MNILLLVLLSCQALYAGQDNETGVRRIWVNLGFGILKPLEEPTGPTLFLGDEPARLLSMSYQHDIHLFSLRYITSLYNRSCEGFGDCTDYSDISLFYGLSTRGEKIHVSVSVGSGLASIRDGKRLFEIDNDRVKRLGFALATQLFWQPIKPVGIGIYGFGNINSERHLFGAMITIQLFKDF